MAFRIYRIRSNRTCFSLFSYPFTYPFPWIITVLSIGMLIGKDYGNLRFSQMNMMKKVIAICLLTSSVFLLFTVGNRIKEVSKKIINTIIDFRFAAIYMCN
jgi:hypothetical protein